MGWRASSKTATISVALDRFSPISSSYATPDWDMHPSSRRLLPGLSANQSDALEVAILVGFLLIWAWIFSLSPLTGEDFNLSRLDHSGSLPQRLLWVALRIRDQWLNWNARFGEQLTIFWLETPKYLLDTVTPLVSLAFVALVGRFSQPERQTSNPISAMVCVYSVLALFWPRLEFFFWRTTATGYLQPLVICLLLAILVSTPAYNAMRVGSKGFALTLPIALLAGACFENVTPGLMLLVLLEWRRQGQLRFQLGPACLLIALLIGWLSVILAPSTAIRTAALGGSSGSSLTSILSGFLISSWPLLLAFGVALAIHLSRSRHSKLEGSLDYLQLNNLGWAALLTVAPLFKAPYIEPRAFSLIWTVMVIVICRTLLAHCSTRNLQLLALLSITFSVSLAGLYNSYNLKASARDAFIRSQRNTAACQQGIPVEPIKGEAVTRLLRLREDWYFSLPGKVNPEVEAFYGCRLVQRQP
ncbi:MAG: DUF6056 family protein [Synechococcaceae cyanobacterium]|jgi:hypothetical protein